MEQRPGLLSQVMMALVAIAGTAAAAYSQMPPQQQYWIKFEIARKLHRLLGRLAHAEGRAGMADELAGRDPLPRYGAAFLMARAQDRVERMLEGMRP